MYGTVNRWQWLGTAKSLPLLEEGDVVLGEAGFHKGRSVVLLDMPPRCTTNAHGIYARHADRDLEAAIVFRSIDLPPVPRARPDPDRRRRIGRAPLAVLLRRVHTPAPLPRRRSPGAGALLCGFQPHPDAARLAQAPRAARQARSEPRHLAPRRRAQALLEHLRELQALILRGSA